MSATPDIDPARLPYVAPQAVSSHAGRPVGLVVREDTLELIGLDNAELVSRRVLKGELNDASVAWNPVDSRFLVSVGGGVMVMQPESMKLLQRFDRADATWSPDGKWLAVRRLSPKADGTDDAEDTDDASPAPPADVRIDIIDGTSGNLVRRVVAADFEKLQWGPDSGWLALESASRLEIWDLEHAHRRGGPAGLNFAWSPNGTAFAQSGKRQASVHHLSTRFTHQSQLDLAEPDEAGGGVQLRSDLTWSADPNRFAVSADTGTLLVLDNEAQLIQRIDAAKVSASGRQSSTFSWAPTGMDLATHHDVDGSVRIWDTSDGTMRAELAAAATGETALTWSPSGQLVAVASASGLRVFDATSGELRHILNSEAEGVAPALWSPAEDWVIRPGGAGTDRWTEVWSLAD